MPSVASAFKAPKFCANPTVVITCANSLADSTCNISYATFAIGCTLLAPPTMPRDIGSSSSPTRFPCSSCDQVVIERYGRPEQHKHVPQIQLHANHSQL